MDSTNKVKPVDYDAWIGIAKSTFGTVPGLFKVQVLILFSRSTIGY